MSDPSPFLKLWWKGVDIVATVISTTASALIIWWCAKSFIKWKHDDELRLDAAKKRQEAAITEELQISRARDERRRRIEALRNVRKALAAEAAALSPDALSVFIFGLQSRLDKYGLQVDRENNSVAERWRHELSRGNTLTPERHAAFLSDLRGLRLPGEEEFLNE